MFSSGGVFSQPIVQYSNKTKKFVKELIRESGVNTQYQRDIERSLYHAVPLPAATNITLAEGTYSNDLDDCTSHQSQKAVVMWHKKKSKAAIQKMIDETPQDIFIPTPPRYDRASKERCQDLMTYEGDLPLKIEKLRTAGGRKGVLDNADPNFRVKELTKEIEERVAWLSALEGLGAASEHRAVTLSQIGLRIRDIEFLDQKKSKLLTEKYEKELLLFAGKKKVEESSCKMANFQS